MKQYTANELKQILALHREWLETVGVKGARANLHEANLRGANLRGANLRWAYLCGADLHEANLCGAYLCGAYLCGAYLCGADLHGANLCGAYLCGAYLSGANLTDAILPHFQICPEEGGFYAWKKTTTGVIKVYIPADAQRTSAITGRKCRASKVKVISGEGCGGSSPTRGNLVYEKGATVEADSFDPDIRTECSNGIHFFMTKKEAEEWD